MDSFFSCIDFFKRLIDILISSLGLLILSPIALPLTLILLLDYKGSPFFIHQRPGKDERLFNLYKFKSMNDKKDSKGVFLPYHLRVTKIGKLIRKYSLDEIPQLLNVLKGDMSLIGPRPLLKDYLPLYNNFQKNVTTYGPEFLVGHKLMAVIPFHGRINLNWMFGISKMFLLCWI